MGKSNNNGKKETKCFSFVFVHVVPFRSYENIFLEVSSPQIFLCFLYQYFFYIGATKEVK